MDELMTTEEFSEAARAPVSTVRYWRAQGIGPVGFKVGKRVLYRRRDVQGWLDKRRREAMRKAPA
jgi:DNA-binding transcriptional MerR regulator